MYRLGESPGELEEDEYEAQRERKRIALADAGWRQEEDKYWEVVPKLIPKLNPKLNPVGGRKKTSIGRLYLN